MPALTDWLETGRLPATPREYITEIVVGAIIAGFVLRLHRNADRLRAIAEYDSLTGLYNRRKFAEDLEHTVEAAHRLGGRLSLVYADVDAFKTINDTFGHAMGDAALQAVAQFLRKAARRRLDMCYRIGGDEFALLLIGDDPEGAQEVMGHIQRHRCVARSHGRQYDVTLSCGAVQLTENETADSLLSRADARMYRAKRGRAPPAACVSEYTLR